MRIFLSPSTQEHNIGVKGFNEETEMNLITDLMIPLLEHNGIQWFRNNRHEDRFKAVNSSNFHKCDIHLAIHSDAGGGNGTTAFTSGTAGSRKFTECIYSRVSTLVPSANRGIKVNTTLTEIVKPKAFSCLVEIAFHDNETDMNFMRNNRQEIATALVQGVCDYYGITFKEPVQKLYKVQVGAFTKKENAELLLARLFNEGFTGFIKEE